MRFVSQITLPPAPPRFAQSEAGRPPVFLRQAQDNLTLRRTDTYASGPSPAVPRDGCPVARPSPRSRYGVPYIMRVEKPEGPRIAPDAFRIRHLLVTVGLSLLVQLVLLRHLGPNGRGHRLLQTRIQHLEQLGILLA